MRFDCSWIFGSFRGGEIRSEGTKVLVVCCCIKKNYAKTQWLKTMNIYYHTVSDSFCGSNFGSSLAGVETQGFSGRCSQDAGRGYSHAKA